jgi:streptogramin lyase
VRATGWIHVVTTDIKELPSPEIGTGHGRGAIEVGLNGIWVTNAWSRTVARLDPKTLRLTAVLGLGKAPTGMAIGNDAVWIVSSNGWLWRVWPAGPHAEGVARLGRQAQAVAVAGSWVWVLRETGTLVRVDPTTCEITLEANVGRGAQDLFAANDSLWVIGKRGRRLLRVDADSGRIEAEVRPRGRILCFATSGSTVWLGCGSRINGSRGWLYGLDAQTGDLGESSALTNRPRALTMGNRGIWVACAGRGKKEGTIECLNPQTRVVEMREHTEWPVYDLALAGSSILAAMGVAITGPGDGAGGFLHMGSIGGDSGGGAGGDGGGGGS